MSDLDPARVPRIDLKQRICDTEPIHVPGTIQSPGALLVANAGDLRVTHVSADLGEGLLGQALATVVGAETMAEVEASLHDGGMNFGRVFRGAMPGTRPVPSDIVVHRYQDRIYVELEPVAEEDESAEVLIARAQTVISALRRAQTRQELCETAVDGLRTLTGFDRAMAYRFDADANGEVIAEARDDMLEPFHGLRYPASDIPPQARRLYLQQRVRVISDVDYVSVPVLALKTNESSPLLDMSYCHLRGISPMHLQYLRNMKVGATLAISLVPEDSLWGMLICHHSGPRRISARMRAMCDLIGQVMSLLIGARGKTEALTERMARQEILEALGQRTLDAPSLASALLIATEM